jgi:hypothetical protein
METEEPIPDEIRAEVEANALFTALRRGDYVAAGRAQERLQALGWYVSREAPRSHRRRHDAPAGTCREGTR